MTLSRGVVAQVSVVALAVAAAVAPVAPTTVERWFSAGLYPPVQRGLTSISNLVPVALLDLLGVAGLGLLVWYTNRVIGEARRKRTLRPLLRGLWSLAATGATVYLVFLLLWGLNYRRLPMTDRLILDAPQPTPAAVADLGRQAVEALNTLSEPAHAEGWPDALFEDAALREGFRQTQQMLSDAPPAVPGRLKPTLLGPYFRWTSVDGMINPFGLEVLANPDLLPFERPFVAAHEWAHLAGYADESEASFVGWLTCLRGAVPSQYSGWLFLYWQVSSEVDAETRTRLAAALGPGPTADVDAVVARVRRGELPWLRTAGWQVYDQYLKANRVEEGIRSYGAVVTLILRARFEAGWTPVRRTAAGS